MHVNHSGHAYLELIEKDSENNKILARMRATIWSYTFRMLRPYFEATTGYQFAAGIKVLLNASVEFHAQYSISLNIKDIDPAYTLGDLARKKAEILERLDKEGVMEMNRQLDFPMVPQRIAVISSPTAAGFEDFLNTLSSNIYNFSFSISLFQAVMQGEKAEESVISALEQIFENEEGFDVVVLIRGGGASIELDCFNGYDLAFHITQFPLPVITGIGHERDETIADMVAHTKLKTPTAVAEFLIDRLAAFSALLEENEEYLRTMAKEMILEEKEKVHRLSQKLLLDTRDHLYRASTLLNNQGYSLKNAVERNISSAGSDLREKSQVLKFRISALIARKNEVLQSRHDKLQNSVYNRISSEEQKVKNLEKVISLSNPEYILSRGYSITTHNGKLIKDEKEIKSGDELNTILYKGKIKSKVQ
jgi:exodeoxyribonuclease VII large subunit